FCHEAPSVIYFSDGERAAQVAALLGPAGDPGLERAIQLGDLLAGVPLRPAGHVDPDLPDLGWISLEGCLALEQMHGRLSEACRLSQGWLKPHENTCSHTARATAARRATAWSAPQTGYSQAVAAAGASSVPYASLRPCGQLPAATSP